MIQFIKKNFIAAALSLVIALVLLNVVLTIYNRSVMIHNNELKLQTEEVKQRLTNIFESILRRLDLGLRGYALTKNSQLLDPYEGALKDNQTNLRKLDSLFVVQKLDTTVAQFESIKSGIDAYIVTCKQMKVLAEEGNIDEFVKILNQDKGYDLWRLFQPFYEKTIKYEDVLIRQATDDYIAAQNRNVFFQLILIFVSLPTMIFVIQRLRKEEQVRQKTIFDFDNSIRYYLYNSGEQSSSQSSVQSVITSSIENLKKASQFVKEIASGNYSATWQGLTAENQSLNNENLSGDLLRMRDEMKKIKEADERRLWATEGLSKFSELIRHHQNQKEKLLDEIVRFLTKYLRANQSSLFVLNDDDTGESYLELGACYAYDKKKFVQKRVNIGEGMLGQVYLEGSTLLLKKIPSEYVHITSGLGEATPTCLVIIPLKYNDRVEALLEMASFTSFDEHQIAFLEKAGEFVASSINAATIGERTSKLLRQSQEQSEMLRSQEEELRQNMEEMQATQEELARKVEETRLITSDLQVRESVFSLTTILSESDLHGTITLANDKLTEVSKYSRAELIGRGHNIFRHPDMPKELFRLMWDVIKDGKVFKGFVKNRAKDGTHYWVDAVIMPVFDNNGRIIKYIGARYHIRDDAYAKLMYNRQSVKLGLPQLP